MSQSPHDSEHGAHEHDPAPMPGEKAANVALALFIVAFLAAGIYGGASGHHAPESAAGHEHEAAAEHAAGSEGHHGDAPGEHPKEGRSGAAPDKHEGEPAHDPAANHDEKPAKGADEAPHEGAHDGK